MLQNHMAKMGYHFGSSLIGIPQLLCGKGIHGLVPQYAMATPLASASSQIDAAADPLDASSVEDFEVLEVSEMGPEEMSLASVTVSQQQAEETRSNMTLSGISVSDYELVDQDTSNQLKNQLEALEELMLRLSIPDAPHGWPW